MDYQVIAFDLDGTLLNSEGKILAENINAIQYAKQKGIKVVLVTGRHHTAVLPYYYQLELNTPIICCNGTYVYDATTDSTPLLNPLSKLQAKKILDTAKKYGSHVLLYSRNSMNFSEINPHMEKFLQWVDKCPIQHRPSVQQVADLYQLVEKEEIIWKCVISSPSREIMLQVVDELPNTQFSCEWSWIDRVDIANVGNSKGARLVELLNSWGISTNNVIAFGDNHNDISMLQSVGLGVAMGNAEQAVKEQVSLVTTEHNQAGIANVIYQHIK